MNQILALNNVEEVDILLNIITANSRVTALIKLKN